MNVFEIGAAWESALTAGDRRKKGSHYTPEWLAQQVTERTLQPQVYRGMAQGIEPSPSTLKCPEQILALRVADIACGAGAFLFTSCHYLALKLCEAWAMEKGVDSRGWRLLPWVPGKSRGQEKASPASQQWFEENLPRAYRLVMEHCIRGVDMDYHVIELVHLMLWINAKCAPGLLPTLRNHIISDDALQDEWMHDMLDVFDGSGGSDCGGFDAIVGNPPFMGGQKITGVWGKEYRDDLVERIAKGKRGSADLCAYFLLHGYRALKPGGTLGLITTNTILQGDTKEVGIDQIVEAGGSRYYTVPSMPWPGKASVHVSQVHLYKGEWQAQKWMEV